MPYSGFDPIVARSATGLFRRTIMTTSRILPIATCAVGILALVTAVRAAQLGSVVGWGSQVTPLVEPGTRFKAIAAGRGYESALNLAIKSDGTFVMWGFPPQG